MGKLSLDSKTTMTDHTQSIEMTNVGKDELPPYTEKRLRISKKMVAWVCGVIFFLIFYGLMGYLLYLVIISGDVDTNVGAFLGLCFLGPLGIVPILGGLMWLCVKSTKWIKKIASRHIVIV